MSPIRSWLNSAWVGTPKISVMRKRGGAGRLKSLYERTIAILQRPERLIGGNRRAGLVQIPFALRFGRLLHLEEIRRMDLAAVGAHRSLAEERIVGRHLLHLGDDLGAVVAL